MRQSSKVYAVQQQHVGWKSYRSIIAFILLLASLVIAGSVDAATTQTSPRAHSESVLQQMLEHAYVAYASGDYVTAYERLNNLAVQDIADAQYLLATLYDDGRGVEPSGAMAAYWYRRAARLGHVDAQYNIGVAYANGDGVKKDRINAVRWWRVAAVSGSINAQFNLGIMYLKGDGIRHDPDEAVRWWHKAAQQGDPAAQYNLGALYANGQGVERDVAVALDWWTRAAEQGFEQAIVALRDLRSEQSN